MESAPFTLSPNAEKRIAKLLTSEPAGSLLRVAVLGGGCSGFQYKFDFETAPPASDDHLIICDGATVAVDSTSLEFLKNAVLDYVETLGSSAFEIKNPNTTASCGCGNSFSIV
ncbi:MAG: iron-sulfur cluster assembly accessory protein [Rickettsiales bacterium]|nr:iron-sulfur cluster assembly accessory protein [Rickettsiales bacterium]